jgi:hypothetical protein
MRLGNAVVVPSTSFADLMARAPVFNKTPFMEVVGANAGMTAGLAGRVLDGQVQLENTRIQGKNLIKANRPGAIQRLQALTPFMAQSLQSLSGANRLAGQGVGFDLSAMIPTPEDLIARVHGIQSGLNKIRGEQYPWISGSQEGTRALLRGT